MRDLVTIATLALRDALHGWITFLCIAFGIAVALAPLLILFGFKHGVIASLSDELQHDPVAREVRLVGQGQFDPDWFGQMQSRNDVGFLVPATRFLASSIDIQASDPAQAPLTVDLVPTAVGDPLTYDIPPVDRGPPKPSGEVFDAVISDRVAQALKINPGDYLHASIGRRVDDQVEVEDVAFAVMGVLPKERHQHAAMFISVSLLSKIENYREGRDDAITSSTSDIDQPREFASFRLYANTIDDVESLHDHLIGQGLDIITHLYDIERINNLDQNLTRLFILIVLMSASAFAISTALSFYAIFESKKKEVSLLGLIGMPRVFVVLFPIIQGIITSLIGCIISFAIYYLIAPIANSLFVFKIYGTSAVAKIELGHLFVALVATATITVAAAGISALRISRIPIHESLRDD